MATTKSMTDVAFDLMSAKKRAVQFSKLWADVAKATGADNESKAQFYSDLTLDGRFTRLKDNKWDLKARRKFAESFIDVTQFDIEDNENEYSPDGEEEAPIENYDEN